MECPAHDASGLLSVPSAVDMLMKDLEDHDLAVIRATAYDDLIDHHFGLGLVKFTAA